MSKSKKNVVDPNDIIDTFGADTARWFMLSDSPPERDLQWSDTGITAAFRFLNKLFDMVNKYNDYNTNNLDDVEVLESLKSIINRVTENIESFQFNKSVAKIYEFVNVLNLSLTKNKISKKSLKWSLKRLSLILQPFVPHISEEIWQSIGESSLCINQSWPIEEVKKRVSTKIAIQINGKTKEVIEIDEGLQEKEVINFVMKNKKIKKKLSGKSVKREIYVPGKILNLVI